MLNNFPDFKKLTLDDITDIEIITRQFPPYSDHNPAGLWTYNINDAVDVCNLNGNFIIKTFDYITQEPFLSFIGNKKPYDTIKTLLSYADTADLPPLLKLIPEDNIKNTEDFARIMKDFNVVEDRNNFDYVIAVNKMVALSGNKYFKHKRLIRNFERLYGKYEVKKLDVSDPDVVLDIGRVFEAWVNFKHKDKEEAEIEFKAINRVFKCANVFKFVIVGVYLKGGLIGFTVNEHINDEYYVAHFGKADPKYKGIFQVLEHETARVMQKLGCKYMNNEQDLGLEGLKKTKELWYPEFFLKKYTISKK